MATLSPVTRAFVLAGFACVATTFAQPSNASGEIVCSSKAGERQSCPADTSDGILLIASTGDAACLLGKTWGYDDSNVWVADGCSGRFTVSQPETTHFGRYTPGAGLTVADTEYAALNIKLFSYVRYLNEEHLDGTYTNAFGDVNPVKPREDIQVNKMLVYFLGWIATPKLHYLAYVWSSNVSQGQVAQVVVAGNLTYAFNDHFVLGGGINSLPGVRSTEGNFPYWLGVDERLIADEFFRPSYTTGIFLKGRIRRGLEYQAMLGNNLSQLGIDAGQLDDGLNTFSTSLVWMPTTGEFGATGSFGDFEGHRSLATRIGAHFTRSDEDNQNQPNPNSFDNVQIRLSDGTPIFVPGLLGPGVTVTNVTYRMMDFDTGFKYRGVALEGEYYKRWLGNFRGPGTPGLPTITDQGYQLQLSAMVKPKTFQLYTSHSKVFGDYGNPWDFRVGANWYPWQHEGIRANFEFIQLRRSPVGGLSLPYPVGGNGPTFSANFLVNF